VTLETAYWIVRRDDAAMPSALGEVVEWLRSAGSAA
jgi:hypothetical protein